MDKILQIHQTKRVFYLTWVINNICTNHCDYCPSVLHTGKNHHYEWDKAKSFAERIIKKYPRIKLCISGGEPTVSPFFPELVEMFYDAGHYVNVTSNGARSVEYWQRISSKLEGVSFSYHPSYAKPDFLDKVLEASKNTVVTVRVMMDSRYWDHAKKFYEDLQEHKSINVEAVRILPEMAFNTIGSEYSDEQNQWLESAGFIALTDPLFKKNPKFRLLENPIEMYYEDKEFDTWGDPNKLILSKKNIFTGWSCNIGLESLFIHYDGTVKKANCFQGGILFHINNHENYQLPNKAEICYQDVCFCPTDISISKVPLFDKDDEIIKYHKVVRFKQETK